MKPRVLVIGGGITGLSCAYRLRDGADVQVLEAADRLGGNIRTEARDGFLLDIGPDSWVAAKPQAARLVKELGLEKDLIGTIPTSRRVYVAWNGELHALPEGLVLGVPTRIGPMVTTPLFTLLGKARMGLEPLIPARHWGPDDDEAVHHFIDRRLGDEAADRLAGPLLGGIFAGDPEKLSVRAAFPQLVDMEKKHGSLIRAMRAARRVSHGSSSASAFLSLRHGLGTMIDALARELGPRTRTGAVVTSVEQGLESPFRVHLASGEVLDAEHVVIAVPPRQLSKLVRSLDGALAESVDEIAVTSSAVAFLAYERKQVTHALDGTGFIAPRSEGLEASAATWVSSKWEGRAPEGHVLLRAFFGGAGREACVAGSDDELVATAVRELSSVMGPLEGAPLFTRVARWTNVRAQPHVGHLVRMKKLHARVSRTPGLHVVGSGYDAHAIPDCIRYAEEAAARILG